MVKLFCKIPEQGIDPPPLHYFYVIFLPHSLSHSLKFWTTTTPLYFSPSLPFFSAHSCHLFLSSFTRGHQPSPYQPIPSCLLRDTTICHEIRTFCLLLCSLFLGVDTIFFLLFGCVIFSRSVLPSFFSVSSVVCPSIPHFSVCLSLQLLLQFIS